MLHLRIASAAVILTIVFTLIGLDGFRPLGGVRGVWMLPLGLFFVMGTSWEFATLLQKRWSLSAASISMAAGFVFVLSALPIFYELFAGKRYPEDCPIGKLGWPLLASLCVTSFFSLTMMRRMPTDPDGSLIQWGLSTLVPLYVGCGASFWIFIRLMEPASWSLLALIGVIAVAKLSDTGAFFVGRAFGKNKLCPSISPGKTIEGAIGGILSSVVASVLWYAVLLPWLFGSSAGLWHWFGPVLFGILLAVVGMLGDLVESTVKRAVQVKDSGGLLPGLGGVWDVTDSLLPTAVAGYMGIVANLVWQPTV